MLFRERKTYANLVIGAPRTSHCAINTDCRSRQCFLQGTLQIHKYTYTYTEFDRERGKTATVSSSVSNEILQRTI